VVEKYLNKKNNLKMLSIGCGGGTAEIAFSKHPCFETILAIDISPKIIEHAKQKITTNDPILHFECKNFITMDLNEQKFDVIHFNSSLHHFFNIEIALNKVKKILKKDGIMIINEYVGPNRFQWTKTRLLFINKVLKEIIPQSHKYRLNNRIKKNNVYRVGWLRSVFSDPSEAIYSAQILKLIHANFTTIAEVELGGNLLHPLLKDIAHHFIEENSINSGLLQKLFLLEDQLMVSENYSDFIFGIYSK